MKSSFIFTVTNYNLPEVSFRALLSLRKMRDYWLSGLNVYILLTNVLTFLKKVEILFGKFPRILNNPFGYVYGHKNIYIF